MLQDVRPSSAHNTNSVNVGAQLRSQPILRWAIAQLKILSWVAYLMGQDARTYQPNLR